MPVLYISFPKQATKGNAPSYQKVKGLSLSNLDISKKVEMKELQIPATEVMRARGGASGAA